MATPQMISPWRIWSWCIVPLTIHIERWTILDSSNYFFQNMLTIPSDSRVTHVLCLQLKTIITWWRSENVVFWWQAQRNWVSGPLCFTNVCPKQTHSCQLGCSCIAAQERKILQQSVYKKPILCVQRTYFVHKGVLQFVQVSTTVATSAFALSVSFSHKSNFLGRLRGEGSRSTRQELPMTTLN